MKYRLILVLVIFSILGSNAQTKKEKEWRISISAFPETSKALLKSIENDVKRIRFYKEQDGDHESYESKFKYNKHWFSAEFDNTGALEDIEVTIRKNELPKAVKNQIEDYLKSNFDNYDFIKIQEQYIPSNDSNNKEFLDYILKNRKETNSNYEIVVAVKTDKIWSILEVTFDSTGKFMNKRPIEQDSYEYIMY